MYVQNVLCLPFSASALPAVDLEQIEPYYVSVLDGAQSVRSGSLAPLHIFGSPGELPETDASARNIPVANSHFSAFTLSIEVRCTIYIPGEHLSLLQGRTVN